MSEVHADGLHDGPGDGPHERRTLCGAGLRGVCAGGCWGLSTRRRRAGRLAGGLAGVLEADVPRCRLCSPGRPSPLSALVFGALAAALPDDPYSGYPRMAPARFLGSQRSELFLKVKTTLPLAKSPKHDRLRGFTAALALVLLSFTAPRPPRTAADLHSTAASHAARAWRVSACRRGACARDPHAAPQPC